MTSFLLDLPFPDAGKAIGDAINAWLRTIIDSALNPAVDALSHAVLQTPHLEQHAQIARLTDQSRGFVDVAFVLVIMLGGLLIMAGPVFESHYTAKLVIPRLLFGALLANVSPLLVGQAITIANALSAGFIGGGVDPRDLSVSIQRVLALPQAGNAAALLLLGGVVLVLVFVLLVVYILRVALLTLGIIAAPLMLATYALPGLDGLARLWGRLILTTLGLQVIHTFLLIIALRLFLAPGGDVLLGLPANTLVDFLVVVACLYLMVRVPFWLVGYVLGRHGGGFVRSASQTVKLVAIRALARG